VLKAVATLVAVVALVPAGRHADAGKRKSKGKRGKVVRVERSRFGAAGALRVCQLGGNNTAVCYGRAPQVGDVGAVLDTTSMYGEGRILSVTPTPDSCNNVTSWSITFDPTNTAISQLSYGAVLVIDFQATAQSRTLPTNGQVPASQRQGETQYVTIDADGDSTADVYISAYTCDAAGNVVPWGQGQIGYCMGYWVDGANGWDLQRTDIVRSC